MRRFLRETYIGAIAVGFLSFQTIQALVQSLENPYIMWIARRSQPSVLMPETVQYVNKPALYRTLGEMVLYLFFALLLGTIIYSGKKAPAPAGGTASEKAANH